jgi:hypothetical protein
MTNWNYETEYNKLLETLDKDTRPWRPVGLLPEDGTKVYLKCDVDYKGDTRYDVGCYEKFSDFWQDQYGEDGEWNTEFGNCESITGWKLFEESVK